MRGRAWLACLLLLLLATPGVSAVSARAQDAADRGLPPSADDADEEVGNDKAEREDPAPMRTAGGDQRLGLVRRADGDGPDWDEDSRPRAPHPQELAHPDHDVVVCEAGCDGSPGSIERNDALHRAGE